MAMGISRCTTSICRAMKASAKAAQLRNSTGLAALTVPAG
ncbi:Uncharacterised protein [Mycobacteroides abscessus subsp. abscessus]|nr:Uncharacterised protein [Mycobacteroides abscessus subsp. abscessus]